MILKSRSELVNFFCDFRLICIFQQKIAPKLLEIDQDNLHKKFEARNIDFNRLSFDLFSRSPL